MSTRYGDRGFGRYGDSDEDRTEDYEREREGERGYGLYGARADRSDYGATGRDYAAPPRGYSRGRGGEYGGDYSTRDYPARDYGSRDYGSREYGSRDYSSQYGAPRHGREGGYGGYGGSPPRRREGEDYGREYGGRGYGREYARRQGRGEERVYGRPADDERDEVRSFDTDYGRTTSRFYGRSGYEYGREDYDDDERGGYRGREYVGRDEGRGEGGVRGWLDRAAEGVRSLFGEEGGGRHGDERRGGRGEGRYRGRGPRNYRRSDDRIREDASDRLTDNEWLDASDVEVSVVAGEVTLSGTVDSRYAKRLAEEICESVSGVYNVRNNLRVRSAQPADYGTAGTAGAFGGAAALPSAPDVTAATDTGSGATNDAPDLPPTGRSSRAAGGS